jgi:ADP-L-glycero-D-manno-heptose 6-epimerase
MLILTGGAGFIGANTLKALNRRGRSDILVVDNVARTEKWKNLVGCAFYRYLHKDALWRWLDTHSDASLDAVLHLGACTDTLETDFDYLHRNNVDYSRRIYRLCTERNIPLVYASSAATYGDGAHGFSDRHEDTDRYRPINPYGYSKHLFDLWALRQTETPSRWYGVKFFNVYGPRENHKGRMASVARFAIPQALETGRIRLFKSHRPDCRDGEQRRDFVFVEDVVDIVLHLLEFDLPSGLYNAGSGSAQTFNHLAEAIFGALERPVCIEYFDMPESLRDSYQYFTEADMGKLLQAGYSHHPTTLEDGIRQYVQWLLK